MASEPRGERIEIHLGALCNNKCVFCVSAQAREERAPWAPFDVVVRRLEEFRRAGGRAVGFLGGEPTVYPKIVEAVAAARALGYTRIALCTNGMRFADADFCAALADAGLTRATVSLHSHRADIEDGLITLVPRSHERKVQGLRNLLALRARGLLRDNVSLNPVVCRPTLPYLEDFVAFAAGLGLDDVRFNYIWPEGAVAEDPAWIPPYREAVPRLVRVALLNERRRKLRLSFGGVPRCVLRFAGAPARLQTWLAERFFDEAALDPPIEVAIANHVQRAMPEPSSRFLWQTRKRDQLKTMGETCAACRHAASCDGVWRSYAALYGVGELAPVPAE